MERSVLTARLFEFYVRALWPIHRVFVASRISRRCKNCAASERMSPLGPRQVCRLCTEQKTSAPVRGSSPRAAAEKERQLAEIIRSHQGRGVGSYDALALFSGGKDSTYMIRRIQDEFPSLRLLAFSYDNNVMSPVAKDNIQRLVARMNVDHVMIRPSRSFSLKLFRYCLTHLNAAGGYGTLDFSDGELMLDTARNLAAEKNIPLILCGYSRYQVENGLGLETFESPREKELTDRIDTAGLRLTDIFEGEELDRWWRPSRRSPDRVARLIFPLAAWDLQERTILESVQRWGLIAPSDSSPIVTNHALIPLLGVVDVHRLGYSSFEPEFCRMIREGKANRRDWQATFELLEYCALTGLFVKKTIEELLKMLDLSTREVGIDFSAASRKR